MIIFESKRSARIVRDNDSNVDTLKNLQKMRATNTDQNYLTNWITN